MRCTRSAVEPSAAIVTGAIVAGALQYAAAYDR
jgi:hypothetical protein